jgi:hypothetical protein
MDTVAHVECLSLATEVPQRRPPPTEPVTVLDVVVDQAEVVHQLDGGGERHHLVKVGVLHCAGARPAHHQGGVEGEQGEEGAQALAGDPPPVGSEGEELGVSPAELVADRPPHPGILDQVIEEALDLPVDPRAAIVEVPVDLEHRPGASGVRFRGPPPDRRCGAGTHGRRPLHPTSTRR